MVIIIIGTIKLMFRTTRKLKVHLLRANQSIPDVTRGKTACTDYCVTKFHIAFVLTGSMNQAFELENVFKAIEDVLSHSLKGQSNYV